ncbi:MAG TPA: fibronectin type III domain-containing protein, partial [Candidatus Peribacteria bacterium]|nr:fibronectin type III domain-containing protein [Candidatus Peribacteria bacterium]
SLSRLPVNSSPSSSAGSFLDILQSRGNSGSTSSTGTAGTPIGGANSAFTLLQVQNVRVTSKDTNIFLGWQGLTSTDLAGYNVYYGTVSGKYINRRSVPDTSASLVIRDLEPGTQYFLAVRAFNSKNQETVFSHEVSIIVGKPESSSSPLAAVNESDLPPEENPIEVHNGKNISGETGMSSTFALLALASAGVGTFFAWRRQLHLPR